MRIAIDTIFFTHPQSISGITRVWETILNNLEPTNLQKLMQNTTNASSIQNPSNYELILLIRGNNTNTNSDTNTNTDKVKGTDTNTSKNNITNTITKTNLEKIVIKEFNYLTMYRDVEYLNTICKQYNIDYFISTYYTYCTIIPNIILIHDMIPEIFNFPKNHMWIQKDLAIKNATYFITISKTTANDLTKFYQHIKNKHNHYKITTIYNAILPILDNELNKDDVVDKPIDKPINKLFEGVLPKKYIFAIASNNEPYKNIKLITDFAKKYTFQLIQKLNTQIPIIFLVKQNLPNNHIIANGVLYITNVSDIVLNMLYKNALCFISPSLYEGFGLPIFEAFTHKTPVIALDIPIYQELAPNAINFIDNDADNLFEKICSIIRNIDTPCNNIIKKVENGYELVKTQMSLEKQILAYHNFFNSLGIAKPTNMTVHIPVHIPAFINIILQSYNETIPERREELEYCIKANLDNPYIAKLHDFGYQTEKYLPEYITKHPKYISMSANPNTNPNKWLTYETAFKYASNIDNIIKYGEYWGIINCDIFLDNQSKWYLIRGQLNNDFILAQSRHELKTKPKTNIDNGNDGNGNDGNNCYEMDVNFARLYHAHTQDGWFFKAPVKLHTYASNIPEVAKRLSVNFELGMLGCDNAIADRLVQSGYKIINQPETYKIIHYDIAKGKNSTNYLEKHSNENKDKDKKKPKNNHPERIGSYLVPNYDHFIRTSQNNEIDLLGFINSIGGLGNISNWEKYKIISDLLSSRVIINNPD